jgi:hypothetical protein
MKRLATRLAAPLCVLHSISSSLPLNASVNLVFLLTPVSAVCTIELPRLSGGAVSVPVMRADGDARILGLNIISTASGPCLRWAGRYRLVVN